MCPIGPCEFWQALVDKGKGLEVLLPNGDPDSERYGAARARCEAAVRRSGHTINVSYPVDERLHALLCEVCGAMAWVSLSGGEEH